MCGVMEAAWACDRALEAVACNRETGRPCEVCAGMQQHSLREAGCTSQDVERFCSTGNAATAFEAFVSLTSATCNFRSSRGRQCSGNILPQRFFWQMCTQLSWAGSLYDNHTDFFSPRVTAEAFIAHCHREFPGVEPGGFNQSWIQHYATLDDLRSATNLIISGGGCACALLPLALLPRVCIAVCAASCCNGLLDHSPVCANSDLCIDMCLQTTLTTCCNRQRTSPTL